MFITNKPRDQGDPPAGATEWPEEAKICTIAEFEQLFYDSAASTWKSTTWMGVPVQKTPTDLWMYQQILYDVRPDVIVETGTLHGGSALYLAHLCDLIGKGSVISIDLNPAPTNVRHDRIDFFTGDSVDLRLIDAIREVIRYSGARTVLVILDSDHECEHVSRELELYSQFVTPGSYIICEDTNLGGHPVWPNYGPSSYDAVNRFLAKNDDFERDVSCERLMLTFNRGGYLRRRTADD